jgi:hypothetical protein
VAAFFPREAVSKAQGETGSFSRPSASGYGVTFHFCRNCGSNLCWEPERMPHLIGVVVGAFADPDFQLPDQAVWADEKHVWLSLPDEVRQHPQNPIRSPRSPEAEER